MLKNLEKAQAFGQLRQQPEDERREQDVLPTLPKPDGHRLTRRDEEAEQESDGGREGQAEKEWIALDHGGTGGHGTAR